MFQTIYKSVNWAQIKEDLLKIAEEKLNANEIIQTLLKFKYFSDQDEKKNKESYLQLKLEALKAHQKELPKIYKKIAQFLLKQRKVQIPLFYQNIQKEHTFTKEQIMYLLCNMAMCLTPTQEYDKSHQSRSTFSYFLDFSYIFMNEEFKTQALMQFFNDQLENVKSFNQKFTIRRQVAKQSIEELLKEKGDLPMSKLTMEEDDASIQDYYGDLKADFANKFIGGGALMSGCVQEELMFVNHPELYMAGLLCEVMSPKEALIFTGFRKHFKTSGYGWTSKFAGKQTHQYSYDKENRANEWITAIDAIHFSKGYDLFYQFSTEAIHRELLKSYIGFNVKEINRVVTGNWGCGAFNGDLQLKFLIQWLSTSMNQKELVYCPFGHREFLYNEDIISQFSKKKIGQAYEIILKAGQKYAFERRLPTFTFYDAVKECL